LGLRRNKQNCGREQCRFEAVRGKFACHELRLLKCRMR
jgi:hypothetical protein